MLIQLDSRNRTNVAANLETLSNLANLRDDLIPAFLVNNPLEIGEGNRVCDWLDKVDRRRSGG